MPSSLPTDPKPVKSATTGAPSRATILVVASLLVVLLVGATIAGVLLPAVALVAVALTALLGTLYAGALASTRRAEQALVDDRERAARAESEAKIDQQRILLRLAQVALVFGSARRATDVYRALADFLATSIPCSRIGVSLFDAERRTLALAFVREDGYEIDPSTVAAPGPESPAFRAIETGEIVRETEEGVPGRCRVVAPMSVMGNGTGVVEVESATDATFTHEHVTVVRVAANLAAIAVENAKLVDRERLQQDQMREAQKMEAIGRLAGGVAHDFNNLLTVIAGYCSLGIARLREDDPLRADLAEIQRAGERATALTSQLLAFSRRQILAPKVLDLNAVVAEMDRMLGRMIGEDIVVRTSLAPDLNRVRVDPSRIEQVIVNLAVNARDALPAGGVVEIETGNAVIGPGFAEANEGARAGRYVRLTVRDNGMGMDEGTRRQAFEPFFTTKPLGQGTGLGLATVYGIVKQSDGFITIASEVGSGSTFSVYLPSVGAAATAVAPESPRTPVPGTERILLVEDEDAVRSIARIALGRAGYDVVDARSGDEALAACQDGRWVPDVVVTDVVMPGMTGPEVADRLAARYPQVKVILMSGYAEDELVRRSLSAGDRVFLPKPFTPQALLHAVRAVLDTPS